MSLRVIAVCLLCALEVLAQTAKPQAPAKLDAKSSEQQLMQADRDFARATAQQRAHGWMQFMADNAVILRATPLVGKEAIWEVYSKLFADQSFTLTWEPVKAEAFAPYDIGYTVGKFTRKLKDERCGGATVTSHGTYLTTWQKQKDGSWKVIADVGSVADSTGCSP